MSGPDDKQKRIDELEAELAQLRGERQPDGQDAAEVYGPTRISAAYGEPAREKGGEQ